MYMMSAHTMHSCINGELSLIHGKQVPANANMQSEFGGINVKNKTEAV